MCVRNDTGVCSKVFSANLKPDLDKCIGKSSCSISNLKSYVTTKKDLCTSDDSSFMV